jgi:hypothetical protein
MTGFLCLLAATIASMELLARTRVIDDFLILSRLGRRAGALLIRRGVSEWAKEKAMRLLAWRLLAQSFASLSALLLVAAPLILVLALDGMAGFGARTAWSSIPARTALLALSTLYMIGRKRHRRQPGDAFGERKLQRIALGTRFVPELSFDLERQIYRRQAGELPVQQPIFVTGLARAGTSVIMRALHRSGGFAALTYRDLPFPLAPNLWARLSKPLRRELGATERAHGDGVLHDLDSPEAIEEMFWRHHEGDRYCRADGLSPVAPREETIDDFVDYVRLVQLRYGRPRYLSKNNNNVLRLPALIAAFPDAQLIHPFRDPAQQAASLLNQHRRACRLAAGDPFRARFMTWLGHHEFGADRRRFLLPDGPAGGDDPESVDYWLKSWIAVHLFLLNAPPTVRARQIFVDYDQLVGDAVPGTQRLGERLGLPLQADDLHAPALHHVEASPRLMREARQVHAALRGRAGGELDVQRRRA